MSEFNPYQPPVEPGPCAVPAALAPDHGPNGLGGWLILVGIGIVLSPFRLFIELRAHFQSVFSSSTWEVLTTPGAAAYHPAWAPFLIGESAFNVCVLSSWIYMNYLFFAKKRAFPKWYIWTQAGTLLFLAADSVGAHLISPDSPWVDADALKEILRSLVVVCIWVPYMIRSKRVAATFVR